MLLVYRGAIKDGLNKKLGCSIFVRSFHAALSEVAPVNASQVCCLQSYEALDDPKCAYDM